VPPDGVERLPPGKADVIGFIEAGAHGFILKDATADAVVATIEAVAPRLGIATHTVKSHVRNILRKLGLRTRLEVAVQGRRGPTDRMARTVPAT